MLPPNFHFSQNNLQDYTDCPRRFELRYIQKLKWPAPVSEPVLEQERLMEMGKQFHLLVQQDVLGVPRPVLSQQAESQGLQEWWQNYLEQTPLADLPLPRQAEHQLSAPLAGFRLVAQYDLLAVEPHQSAVIVDWKTSRRKTPRPALQKRLQTRIYPFLLARAGAHLGGGSPILPEQIRMIYWFTDFPGEPESFHYSSRQQAEDLDYLSGLIGEIASRAPGQFPLTLDERKCAYCVYRSLCERGGPAGDLAESEDDPADAGGAIDLDFEQIGELGL